MPDGILVVLIGLGPLMMCFFSSFRSKLVKKPLENLSVSWCPSAKKCEASGWNSFYPLYFCSLDVSIQDRCYWLHLLMGRKGHFLMVKPSVTTEELRQSPQRHPHHWRPGFVRLFPKQGLHFESLLICLFPSCHNMPSRLVLKSSRPPLSSANSQSYIFSCLNIIAESLSSLSVLQLSL